MVIRFILIILSMLFLSSCQNAEKEARVIFNQALKDWSTGNIVEAERKFDSIEEIYLTTEVATESIKERALLKEKYKTEYDVEKSKRNNRGIFSRKIYSNLSAFYQDNKHYPDKLAGLNIQNNAKYLPLCVYKKGLFDSGFQLDCTKADIALRNDRRKSLSKNIYSKTKKNKNQPRKLSEFNKAKSTWATKFNATHNVPENGFYAYYINTNNPSELIKKETVSDISINYAWDKFLGIKSEDFGGYWIGRINLQKNEIKAFAIGQSWSKTRFIIDGYIVYEGGSDAEILLDLEKGSHLIEVEYINNWHTTRFSLSFMDKSQKYSMAEIKKQLVDNKLGEYDIHYAALYESASKDQSVVLNIDKKNKPIVLFLSSYRPIKWVVSNPYMATIKAIVYGGYSPGSTVVGDLGKSTLLLPSTKSFGSYTSEPTCRCTAGHFHCQGSSLLSTKNRIEQLTGHALTGFSGKYSASALKVPQIIINEKYVEDQKLNNEKIKLLRSSCAKQSDPDFEKIFNTDSVN